MLRTICGTTLMPFFTIKSIALLIIDSRLVFSPALFTMQPVFAIYALKWRD